MVDLETSTSSCQNFASLPLPIYGFQNKPIICGGFDGYIPLAECYLIGSTSWTQSFSMVIPRAFAGLTLSPFTNKSQILFVTGGQTNSGHTSTAEVLTNKGWEIFAPSLPITIGYHCMILVNATTAMIIAGVQSGRKYCKSKFNI